MFKARVRRHGGTDADMVNSNHSVTTAPWMSKILAVWEVGFDYNFEFRAVVKRIAKRVDAFPTCGDLGVEVSSE